MSRSIEYLLHTYDKKAIGEIWTMEHELQYKQEARTKRRIFTLDCIVNEIITKSRGTFIFPKAQRDRAIYLIKNLDFYLGRTTEEQYITMILIYVKLESNPNRKFNDYLPIIRDYGIDVQTFVKFLVRLNKYHISN